MGKGKIKKILVSSALGIMALAMPFVLTGCDKNNNTNTLQPQNVRVQDGWVQYTNDGETWTNLVKAEYPMSEYDFRIHEGYVQWATDGETWINLIKVEEEAKSYTITLDYGAAKDIFSVHGGNTPQTLTIEANTWMMYRLPWCYDEGFVGWFIKGTDKEITKHDCISGDVELEARFDFEKGPVGAYHNGKYVKTWQQMIDDGDIVVEDGVLLGVHKPMAYNETFYELSIDNSITEIGSNAFDDYPLLKHVTIPDSVKKIGRRAFYGCDLTTVKIGNNVEIIEEYAFSCDNLTSLTIPRSTRIIENSAFYGCENLISVSFNNQMDLTAKWKVYDRFDYDRRVLCQDAFSLSSKQVARFLIAGCRFEQVHQSTEIEYIYLANGAMILTEVVDKTLTELDLTHDNVIEIFNYAFSGCKDLTSLTIPNSVEHIGKYVFNTCENLTTINFEDKEGYKWQVFEDDEWIDAQDDDLFNFAKLGKELRRVAEKVKLGQKILNKKIKDLHNCKSFLFSKYLLTTIYQYKLAFIRCYLKKICSIVYNIF